MAFEILAIMRSPKVAFAQCPLRRNFTIPGYCSKDTQRSSCASAQPPPITQATNADEGVLSGNCLALPFPRTGMQLTAAQAHHATDGYHGFPLQ
jgi:hypothetical protein